MQETISDPYDKAGLGFLVGAVRRRLKQVAWARLTPYNLTPQQFWVILVLLEEKSLSLHALAERVWMDDPTASRIVKAMVGRGLLRSAADPGHGRRIMISLTPEAEPMAHELKALSLEFREGMAKGLSAKDRNVLRQGLRALIENLDGMLVEARAELGEASDRHQDQEAS